MCLRDRREGAREKERERERDRESERARERERESERAGSYTHLTLPMKRIAALAVADETSKQIFNLCSILTH